MIFFFDFVPFMHHFDLGQQWFWMVSLARRCSRLYSSAPSPFVCIFTSPNYSCSIQGVHLAIQNVFQNFNIPRNTSREKKGYWGDSIKTCKPARVSFSLDLQLKLAAVLAVELALVWRWFGAAVVLFNGAKLLVASALTVLFCRAPLPTRACRALALVSIWLLNLLSLTLISRDFWDDLFVCCTSDSLTDVSILVSISTLPQRLSSWLCICIARCLPHFMDFLK